MIPASTALNGFIPLIRDWRALDQEKYTVEIEKDDIHCHNGPKNPSERLSGKQTHQQVSDGSLPSGICPHRQKFSDY